MSHVYSIGAESDSEYLTVEEVLKILYPTAKRFLRCNAPHVCCTCSIINQEVTASIPEDDWIRPPVSIPIKRHRLDPYFIGENKVEVWIYDCVHGCGTVYYNYMGDLKVRIKI